MLHRTGVLTGVGVLGLITTTNVAAAETEPEMNPAVPDRQTLRAAVTARLDLLDQAEMFARW